jgi:hypothetical protein
MRVNAYYIFKGTLTWKCRLWQALPRLFSKSKIANLKSKIARLAYRRFSPDTPPETWMQQKTEVKRHRMVNWYDPRQLIVTAADVLTSGIIGAKADLRLVEALAANSNQIYDYSSHEGDFWFNYVADLGDGWNSTYHVAYAISQPELAFDSGAHVTRRGNLLIFGGDTVYPVASNRAYRERLIEPYRCALQSQASVGDVFALPGNHDWYDGLIAFGRLFCSTTASYEGRTFGPWRTKQRRSYFALKLPRGWWLVATDVQFSSDVDAPQLQYFRDVARQMQPNDKLILCNAEPHWIYSKVYGGFDADITEHNLSFLEEKVFGHRINVFVAGDLHHYRRHATDDGKQKITAGGGGAFVHPTHGPNVSSLPHGYRLKKSFPPPSVSNRLAWGNLLFLFRNPTFGILTAVLYCLTAWSIKPAIGDLQWRQLVPSLQITWTAFYQSPFTAFWVVALFLGMVVFTDTHSKRYRFTAGPLHALAHMTALFFIGWGAAQFAQRIESSFGRIATVGLLIFAGGWIAGSTIMGLYLLISLNVFHRHGEDAFSALRIEDWKNFLRFKIDPDGKLIIFPVGIRRVARNWKEAPADATSLFVPNDPLATEPELIEPPISIHGDETSPHPGPLPL